MIIVGLTGGIGHGKTTFANLLAQQSKSHKHFESWELICEVADGLRQARLQHPAADDLEAINNWLQPLPELIAASAHTDIDFALVQITPERLERHPENYQKLFEYLRLMSERADLQTTDINTDNKELFRPLLQWLGGYLVLVSDGIWYNEIVRRIRALQMRGYELVTVGGVRYPADAETLRNAGGLIIEIDRPDQPATDAGDITERARSLITPDVVVMNDGNLEQLAACAGSMYERLRMHNLSSQERASDFQLSH